MNKKSIFLLVRRYTQILAVAMIFFIIARLVFLMAFSPGYVFTQWMQWIILLAALLMAGICLFYVNRYQQIATAQAQSEAKFRALSEYSMMGMMMQERTGEVTYANQSAVRIFGFDTLEDLLQADSTSYLVDQMKYRSVFQKILSSGEILNEEIDILNTNGEKRHLLYSAHRDKDMVISTLVDITDRVLVEKETQQLSHIVSQMADSVGITEREKAEEELTESKQLFHLLLESLPQNIYAKDADGRFIFANQHYCKTEGKQLEEIVGKTDFELHPFEMAEKYCKDDLQVIKTGKAIEVEEEHQPLGEEKFFVQVIKTPFYNSQGLTAGTLGIFWDITERKQTEELLRQQSEQLSLLYEASQRLNGTLDLNEIYQAICDFTSSVIPNDSMVISAFAPETNLITCRAFWIDNEWLDVNSFPPIPLEEEGRGTQSIVIRSGKSMLINDFQAALKSAQNAYTVDGTKNEVSEGTEEYDDVMRSALIVPLKSGDAVNGVIQVMSCNLNAYTENQLKLLDALALHIVSAEKNALLYNQVQAELKERKQAEEFLRQRNEEYRLISENTGDIIWILDMETQGFTYASPSVEKLLGYSVQEMMEQSLNNVLTEESFNRVKLLIPDRLALFNENQKAITYTDEFDQIRKDNSIVNVEVSTTFIVNGAGRLQVAGIARDITERKQAEYERQQSEIQFRALFDLSPDAVMLIDPYDADISWPIIDCNVAACLMNGYQRDELIGRSVDIINIDPAKQVERNIYLKQLKEVGNLKLEAFHRRKNGDIFPIEVSTTLIKIGDRELLIGIDRDITERKQGEDALRQSNETAQAILNAATESVFLLDINGIVLATNETTAMRLGIQASDLIGKCMYDFIPPSVAEFRKKQIETVFREHKQFKFEDFRLGAWIESSIYPIFDADGQVTRVAVYGTDITQRKQAAVLQETVYRIAEAAQEAESLQDLYTEIHRNISNVMYAENLYLALYDEDSDLLSFVYAVDENGQMDEEPFRPKTGLTAHVLRTGKSLLFSIEHPTPGLEIIGIPAKVWLGVPLIVHGRTMGVLAVQHYTDVSAFTEREQHILEFVSSQVATTIDRKRTEDVVRLVEKRNSALIENAPDGIALIDMYGNFKFGSPSAYRMFGYAAQDIIGHQALKFMHTDDVAKMQLAFADLIKHPAKIFNMEYRFLHKDGTYRWVEGAYYNLIDEPGVKAVVNNFRDITERKQASEMLQNSQDNLEMAQSVAHLGSWAIDAKTGVESWSKEMFQLFQRDAKQGVPTRPEFMELVYPEDRQLLLNSYQHALENEERVKYEYRVNLPHDNVRYFEASLQSVKNKQGQVGISGTVLDITEARQSEKALRMSDERFRQLAENIQEVFWLYGMKEQKIIYISPAYEIIWGRTCQSLYEKPNDYLESILQEDQPIMLAALGKQARGEHTEAEYRVQRPDGSIRWVWDRGFPIFDETGKLVRTAGLATDITSVKATEKELQSLNHDLEKRVEERTAEVHQSEETYRALFENANDAIFLIQPAGTILRVNERCTELLGYTVEELIGRRSLDFIVPTETDDAYNLMHRLLGGERVPMYERRFIKKNGVQIDTEINLSLITQREGQPKLIQSVVRDITERKRAEEALRESRDQLSAANSALEQASRLKDEFLASMSHELRTPLTGILGLSEALQMQIFGALNEKQIKALKNVEDSGRHLLDLINDILDLSKIEAGKLDMQFEPCSAAEICQASLQLMKGMAHQKKQNIQFSMNPTSVTIRADARRMKQMLVNLLSNAVKFTPIGGELGLEVQALEDQEVVLFSVWDKGIGIKPDELKKLFKPFVQLDSSLARQYSGTGLGLSLVQRMTELHGGSIKLESEPGKGSRFSIILPWSSGTTQPIQIVRNLNTDPLKSTLIIEDNILDVEQVTRYLKEMGITIVSHPVLSGALEKVIFLRPSAILLDIHMPDGSGLDLLAKLKANEHTRNIPVIIISVEERRTDAMKLGASGYLLKPFNLEELRTELEKAATFAIPIDHVMVIESHASIPLVMIADDNEMILEMVTDFLEAQGWNVITTRSGFELLERASEAHPDIMLVDIQMPGMDGMETIRRLRAHTNPTIASVPIIAITALAMSGDREKCLQAGANEYMSKPVALKQLVQQIKELLKKKQDKNSHDHFIPGTDEL